MSLISNTIKAEPPPTPLITTQPKRSWFANLLSFKPEVFTFTSQKSMDETLTFLALKLKVSKLSDKYGLGI